MPAVEITTTQSSIIVKCHDFREAMEQETKWLDDAEEILADDLHLDGLENVRVLLEEQEVGFPTYKST